MAVEEDLVVGRQPLHRLSTASRLASLLAYPPSTVVNHDAESPGALDRGHQTTVTHVEGEDGARHHDRAFFSGHQAGRWRLGAPAKGRCVRWRLGLAQTRGSLR